MPWKKPKTKLQNEIINRFMYVEVYGCFVCIY